jgi:hypothetical protein
MAETLVNPNLNRTPRVFEVYWQVDVAKFIELLDEAGGALDGVFRKRAGVLNGGFTIHYRHTESLNMEVLC